MDWGIVWSTIVALALFIAAMMAVCIPIFLLMAGKMKKRMMGGMMKKMQSGSMSGCPMPYGPSGETPEPAVCPCASQAQ